MSLKLWPKNWLNESEGSSWLVKWPARIPRLRKREGVCADLDAVQEAVLEVLELG